MSIDRTKVLFEGFLQKRKDMLKIKWVTYWFRLQNTTLFFYTKKNGSALHLKGNYYIYTVQSVREVHRENSKRFLFEITMTNGKKKLLAAETETLRQEWVGHLWQAMQLSTSGISVTRCTDPEACEQHERINHSELKPIDNVKKPLPAQPHSAPADQQYHVMKSIMSPVYQTEWMKSEVAAEQITLSASKNQHHNDFSGPSNTFVEGDYDVLPIRKASKEMEESVYDVPQSHKRLAEHSEPAENIYDVPSSLLRPRHTSSEERLEDGLYEGYKVQDEDTRKQTVLMTAVNTHVQLKQQLLPK